MKPIDNASLQPSSATASSQNQQPSQSATSNYIMMTFDSNTNLASSVDGHIQSWRNWYSVGTAIFVFVAGILTLSTGSADFSPAIFADIMPMTPGVMTTCKLMGFVATTSMIGVNLPSFCRLIRRWTMEVRN